MRLAALALLLAVAGCGTTIAAVTPLERDLAALRLTPGPLRCVQQGWVTTCAR